MRDSESTGYAKQTGTEAGGDLELEMVIPIGEGVDRGGPEAYLVRVCGPRMPDRGRVIAVQGGQRQNEAVKPRYLVLVVELRIPIQRKNVAGMECGAGSGR